MSSSKDSVTAFLGEELRRQLDECSRRYKRHKAEIIRAALMHYLNKEGRTGKNDS